MSTLHEAPDVIETREVGGLTAAQKAMRRTGIGGSEIAAVLGLSPYATALDVWRAKVEGLDIEETAPMKRGRILEPAVAQWYAEETGALRLAVPGTLRHPNSAVVLATPDRIATHGDGERVLELKTSSFHLLDQWGPTGTDQVPQGYLLQVALEMGVTGLGRADLAVLIGGDDFRVYHLARDLELEAMLLEAAERFWRDHVVTQRPPEIDGSESCREWLHSRYPKDRAPLLEATPEAQGIALHLRVDLAELEKLEERVDLQRNQLKALIGDAAGMKGGFGSISWRATKDRSSTDWEALAKHAISELAGPEDVSKALNEWLPKFTTTKPGARVFRATWAKES